jgi:hypothetical protein
MITFMYQTDLDKLADDDPAKPVVKQLLEWLVAPGEFPDHPYDPDDHGFIAHVEPGDVDRELDDGFYHAVYLGAGDYGIGFVIPVDAPWFNGDLREVLDTLLDEPSPLTFRSSPG